MVATTGEVQFDITIGNLNGTLGTIHRMHLLCSTPQGIHRESSRITKHIEYLPSLGILFQQTSVLALVNKEAGLLSLHPINLKLQAVLLGHRVGITAKQVARLGINFLHKGQCLVALIVHILQFLRHQPHQSIGNIVTSTMHAHTVSLHHGSISIDVDNQSGQPVTLTVHQSEGFVIISHQPQTATHLQSLRQSFRPELTIYSFMFEGQ